MRKPCVKCGARFAQRPLRAAALRLFTRLSNPIYALICTGFAPDLRLTYFTRWAASTISTFFTGWRFENRSLDLRLFYA
jgi:hypothetical protein